MKLSDAVKFILNPYMLLPLIKTVAVGVSGVRQAVCVAGR